MSRALEYEALEALSRRSLRIYKLTERERLLSEVIIEWSFSRGRPDAIIPDLRYFVQLTGIDKSDVSRTLNEMERLRIIQITRPTRGERIYTFRPHAAWWQDAERRVDVEPACAAAAELDEINERGVGVEPSGQIRLLPVEREEYDDGLSAASREEALATAHAECAPDGSEEQRRGFPLRAAVERLLEADEPSGALGAEERDARIAEEVRRSIVGESPTRPEIGETPTPGQIGESPTAEQPASLQSRATSLTFCESSKRNVLQNVGCGQRAKRFSDQHRNDVLDKVERLADPKEFQEQRWRWVSRVKENPDLVAAGVSDTTHYLRRNKVEKSALGILATRCKALAADMGRKFNLL